MPLTKSKGQMYPWVTHTHSHLAGACPHACAYCYVQAMAKRFPNMAIRYRGPLRLIEEELEVDYGENRTIFIEHMNDLFAGRVPSEWIKMIVDHCGRYEWNTYVFQTKNPMRYRNFIPMIPAGALFGTTIETNRHVPDLMGDAPTPHDRYEGMMRLAENERKFVTIEPILDFDQEELVRWIKDIRPAFVNIGADSKGHGLPEPSGEKVIALIKALQDAGIEIREKHNLARLCA